MQWLIYALVLGYVAVDAIAQGKLNLINRQYVPPTAQAAVNLPLHKLYPTCFILLLTVAAASGVYAALKWGWLWLPIGVLARVALFDPILNRTKGDPLFALGTSATTDKLLAKVPALNAGLRIVALAGSVALVFCL